MDKRLYLDVNHFARHTAWAHPVMTAFAVWAGVGALGLLVVAAWWVCRRDATAVGVAWAGLGTLVAVGLNQPLIHLVARARPYATIPGVEVLVPRGHDFTFPSDHATAAGAVICGLLLAGHRRLGAAALAVGLALAFARVYVGAHYPSDVVAGLAFGAAVVAVLSPVARMVLRPIVAAVERSPLRPVVAAHSAPPPARAPTAVGHRP